jgi:RND family efflux transporter MFP subunit
MSGLFHRALLAAIASMGLTWRVSAEEALGPAVQEFTGTVVAAVQAEIASRLDGLVSRINFTTGQVVQKGDLLFEFDSRVRELALAVARAAQKQSEAELHLSDVDLANARTLQTRNVASDMQLLEAEAKQEIASANVEQARANVSLAELNLSYMQLYAPITGVISQPFVNEGAYITKEARDQSRLATIVQLDPIQVIGQVPYNVYFAQRDALGTLAKATEPLEFSLLLPSGDKYPLPGYLVGGSYEFDPAMQTVAIAVEFPNPGFPLRPGLHVRLVSSLVVR